MNNKIRITIRILAVIVIILSLYYIIMTNAQYKKAETEYTDLNTYTEEVRDFIAVDYDSLSSINKDFIGWLYACDGNISYPVVQSHDNEEYLKTTFNGSRNIAGCIFADYRTPAFDNYQTIIYGHSMNDGSMFRRLVEYKDAEYCKRYPYFYIYTPDGRRKYEIFSVYKKSPVDAVLAYADIPEERPALVKKIEESSMYKISAPDNIVSGGGAVVTLITCDVSNDYYRIVVNGKRVE